MVICWRERRVVKVGRRLSVVISLGQAYDGTGERKGTKIEAAIMDVSVGTPAGKV